MHSFVRIWIPFVQKPCGFANGMTAVLVFAALLVAFHPARAAQFSSDYLLQVCGVDAKGKELVKGGHVACQSYIAGVMDYHNLIRSLGTAPSVDFCVPEGTKMSEIHKNVTLYIMQNHHDQGPFIAAPSVALALYNFYPCKRR